MEKEDILIDTNIFIEHFRNNSKAVDFFESLEVSSNIYFSAITETELLAGKSNNDSTKKRKLMLFLNQWRKIPADNPMVILAGDISREYDVDVPDAIIAATAMMNNLTLLTKNIKHFKKIKELKVKSPY